MGFTLYFVYPMHLMHFRQKKTYIDFFPLFLFLVKFESIQRILPFQSKKKKKGKKNLFMTCLEVQRGGEQRGVEGRRVEGNGYPLLCLDVFKISNGEGSNQPFLLFGCFKNQDREERKLFKQTNLPLFENSLATLVYD